MPRACGGARCGGQGRRLPPRSSRRDRAASFRARGGRLPARIRRRDPPGREPARRALRARPAPRPLLLRSMPRKRKQPGPRVTPQSVAPAPRRALQERWWVAALAAFAAARVLWCAAAFPFLSNVDEPAHYDLVVKYAHGRVPNGLEPYSHELAEVEALYVSPEYMNPVEYFGGRVPQPVKTAAEFASKLQLFEQWAQQYVNKEGAEPPIYYVLAAAWLWIGRLGGLVGSHLLYWLRALDALPAALLVWLGWVTARSVFPESALHRLGVPLLIAVYPQDTFYSIAPDVLSPLFFGLGFLGVLR